MKEVINTIPKPATEEACQQGCLCGIGNQKHIIINEKCPLHGKKKTLKTLAVNN